jgi:hypothetical protein
VQRRVDDDLRSLNGQIEFLRLKVLRPEVERRSDDMAEACVINIGPRERGKRLASGVVLLAASVGLAAFLMATGAGHPWRLSLFPLLWMSGLGFFQALDKT